MLVCVKADRKKDCVIINIIGYKLRKTRISWMELLDFGRFDETEL